MIYGYNPAFFVAILLIVLYPFGAFSTRLLHDWQAGSGPPLESLFYRVDSSNGLNWPYN